MTAQLEIPKEFVEEWNGEDWVYWSGAVEIMLDYIGLFGTLGPVEAQLRKLCENGEIRATVFEDVEEPEEPHRIPPSRWRDEACDYTIPGNCFIGVSRTDLEHWLSQQPKAPKGLRGDIHGPWEADLYGERWFDFERAANELGDKLGISPSAAEAQLRKLCASGEIRALGTDDPDDCDEPPTSIPPSEWPDDDLPRYEVRVSNIDFYRWLNRQSTQPTAGGKQSRITRILKEMFPTGVPNRADCPRQPLTAELVKRDPSLKPLDPKTLKTAIDAYNRQQGSAGKR
jgi:hypothetical protein